MYFSNYGHRNTSLNKCLNSPLSEDPSTSNMVNSPKHFSKLGNSNFIILIDPCDDN